MNYNSNKTVFTATYSDGNALVIDTNKDQPQYGHAYFLCVFENEKSARKLAKHSGHESILINQTTMIDIALEFNSSITWPGMLGIAYVDEDDMVTNLFTDELIKMAYKDIQRHKEANYKPLVIDGQVNPQTDTIDFCRNYFFIESATGKIMEERVTEEDGSLKKWMVIATNKALIKEKAKVIKFTRPSNSIEKFPLLDILEYFTPQNVWNKCHGICLIDENGEHRILRKRILSLLKSRKKMLDKIKENSTFFLDERYFMALDSTDDNWSLIVEYGQNGMEYIPISQHMDALYKMCKAQGLQQNNLKYTNNITLREILASVEPSPKQSFTICVDGDYNHFIKFTREDLIKHCKNSMIDDSNLDDDIDFFCQKDAFILMINENEYAASSITDPSNPNNSLEVILLGDSKNSLLDGLIKTNYPLTDEDATQLDWDMLLYDFEQGSLAEVDGAIYFREDGTFGLVYRDELLDDNISDE